MLSNLVYISFRKPNCTEAEITLILEACNRNNKKLDVTGVLLYSDKQFVQYLEGEYKEIFGLYDKIKLDNRHKNIALVTSEKIDERSFPSWQMAHKKVDFESIEFRTAMSDQEQSEFRKILSGKNTTQALNLLKRFFK